MKKRVLKYEELFNKINCILTKLEKDYEEFNSIQNDIDELNKYYGSKSWYKDIEEYDGSYNAGVLSEDGIWNLLERIKDLNINK